jgi:tRNA A-37 threonylcarbamoyl transferase component Bud32
MKVCPHCGGAFPVDEGFCPMDGKRLRTLHAAPEQAPVGVAPAASHEFVGRVLDRRYRLDEVIGEGAVGVVFRATHTLIGRRFAVKLLRREHADAGDVARRFLVEARVASSIKHPNVVDISDFGELPEGGAYYVMELLEGRSLADAIDHDGPMSPADAGLVALQIANGLAAAHAMGVVHRDLKPDNVFLCAPRRGVSHSLVKLLDFGIARVGPRRITVVGSVLGTPEYMSPEMAQGFDVDHRADLYALGIILFEILTGTVPFYHREIARTIEMHVRAPRPTLESRRPELAGLPHVAALVGALMEVDREGRPASADVAARILGAALAHDLDREAADVVQRATLAIGSNMMPELADPSRAVGWQPGPVWPERGVPSAAAAAPAPAAAPSAARAPAPRCAGRAALAAVAAAAVAGGVTLGAVRWLRPAAIEVSTEPTSEDAEIPSPTPPSEATLDVRAVVEPSPSAAIPAAAGVAELPVAPRPPPPAVVAADVERPALAAERTKTKRRRPEVAPAGSEPASPTPTPTPAPDDPPPPVRVDPPPPTSPTSPRDLKDPFPKK